MHVIRLCQHLIEQFDSSSKVYFAFVFWICRKRFSLKLHVRWSNSIDWTSSIYNIHLVDLQRFSCQSLHWSLFIVVHRNENFLFFKEMFYSPTNRSKSIYNENISNHQRRKRANSSIEIIHWQNVFARRWTFSLLSFAQRMRIDDEERTATDNLYEIGLSPLFQWHHTQFYLERKLLLMSL